MYKTARHIATGGLITLLLLCLLAAKNDPLQQVVEDADTPLLKKKLQEFAAGGIERPIRADTYDIEAVISYAESMLGTRHRMGGYSKKGIDCSGLVKLSHAVHGVELPHSSHEQARYGTIIPCVEDLQRGDLLFFHSTYATSKLVTHAGIYLGDGNFIHASATRGVVISNMAYPEYYSKHYLFATRLKQYPASSLPVDDKI